jgi:hypothetical protein
MNDKDPKVEADKLREEAKFILNAHMLQAMNVSNENGSIRCGAADRFVDCIVSAAILETTIMLREVLFATDDTTNQQGSTRAADSCGGSCHCNES